jgi:hypothetical protein
VLGATPAREATSLMVTMPAAVPPLPW